MLETLRYTVEFKEDSSRHNSPRFIRVHELAFYRGKDPGYTYQAVRRLGEFPIYELEDRKAVRKVMSALTRKFPNKRLESIDMNRIGVRGIDKV